MTRGGLLRGFDHFGKGTDVPVQDVGGSDNVGAGILLESQDMRPAGNCVESDPDLVPEPATLIPLGLLKRLDGLPGGDDLVCENPERIDHLAGTWTPRTSGEGLAVPSDDLLQPRQRSEDSPVTVGEGIVGLRALSVSGPVS